MEFPIENLTDEQIAKLWQAIYRRRNLTTRNASIFELHLQGWKQKDLAEKYHLTKQRISKIIIRERAKHVTEVAQ